MKQNLPGSFSKAAPLVPRGRCHFGMGAHTDRPVQLRPGAWPLRRDSRCEWGVYAAVGSLGKSP